VSLPPGSRADLFSPLLPFLNSFEPSLFFNSFSLSGSIHQAPFSFLQSFTHRPLWHSPVPFPLFSSLPLKDFLLQPGSLSFSRWGCFLMLSPFFNFFFERHELICLPSGRRAFLLLLLSDFPSGLSPDGRLPSDMLLGAVGDEPDRSRQALPRPFPFFKFGGVFLESRAISGRPFQMLGVIGALAQGTALFCLYRLSF